MFKKDVLEELFVIRMTVNWPLMCYVSLGGGLNYYGLWLNVRRHRRRKALSYKSRA